MRNTLAHRFVVLIIFSLVGCATNENAPKPQLRLANGPKPQFRLPPGAQIALMEGQFDKKVDPKSNKRSNEQSNEGPLIQNPVGGAVAGVAGGALVGAAGGFYCGPLFIICSPVLAAGGAVVGGVAGAAKGAQNAEEAKIRAERIESERKRIAKLEAESTELLAQLRLILSSLPKYSVRAQRLLPQPSGKADFVVEFAPPEIKFDGVVQDVVNVLVIGRARLIRLSDNSVVEDFEVSPTISFRPEELTHLQTPENRERQVARLETALNANATSFVNSWIVPLVEHPFKTRTLSGMTKSSITGDATTAEALILLVSSTKESIAVSPLFLLRGQDSAALVEIILSLRPQEIVNSFPTEDSEARFNTFDYGCIIFANGRLMELRYDVSGSGAWKPPRYSRATSDFKNEAINALRDGRPDYRGSYVCSLEKTSWPAQRRAKVTAFLKRVNVEAAGALEKEHSQ